jgi:hypothetical protein
VVIIHAGRGIVASRVWSFREVAVAYQALPRVAYIHVIYGFTILYFSRYWLEAHWE